MPLSCPRRCYAAVPPSAYARPAGPRRSMIARPAHPAQVTPEAARSIVSSYEKPLNSDLSSMAGHSPLDNCLKDLANEPSACERRTKVSAGSARLPFERQYACHRKF